MINIIIGVDDSKKNAEIEVITKAIIPPTPSNLKAVPNNTSFFSGVFTNSRIKTSLIPKLEMKLNIPTKAKI